MRNARSISTHDLETVRGGFRMGGGMNFGGGFHFGGMFAFMMPMQAPALAAPPPADPGEDYQIDTASTSFADAKAMFDQAGAEA